MAQPAISTPNHDTMPLSLSLHLAMHTVIGLFCAFAGGMNLIDPTKILPQGFNDIITSGVGFMAVAGFSWGYVFGIFMARREALIMGYAASGVYLGLAGWIWGTGDFWAAVFLAFVGFYGFWALATNRRHILSS